MGVAVGHMCCPRFHSPLLNKAAPNDLLFTPRFSLLPLLCRLSSHNPPGDPGGESLRAPCDDQRVLERSWQPIIDLGVASCLASHFREGSISYIAARRAVSCLEWTGSFSLPWHVVESDSDRSALCLLEWARGGGKNRPNFVSIHLAHAQVHWRFHPRFQNQHRLVTEEAIPRTSPLPLLQQPQCEEESFLLKMFPDPALLVWRKYIRELMWFWLSRLEMSFMVTFQY